MPTPKLYALQIGSASSIYWSREWSIYGSATLLLSHSVHICCAKSKCILFRLVGRFGDTAELVQESYGIDPFIHTLPGTNFDFTIYYFCNA